MKCQYLALKRHIISNSVIVVNCFILFYKPNSLFINSNNTHLSLTKTILIFSIVLLLHNTILKLPFFYAYMLSCFEAADVLDNYLHKQASSYNQKLHHHHL